MCIACGAAGGIHVEEGIVEESVCSGGDAGGNDYGMEFVASGEAGLSSTCSDKGAEVVGRE